MWAVRPGSCWRFEPGASKQSHSSQNTPSTQSHSRCIDTRRALSKLTARYLHNTTVVCFTANEQDANSTETMILYWILLLKYSCKKLLSDIFTFLKKAFLLYFITKMKARCALILSALFIDPVSTLIKIDLKIASFWKLEVMINLTWCIICGLTWSRPALFYLRRLVQFFMTVGTCEKTL